jgi:hypothetical protein
MRKALKVAAVVLVVLMALTAIPVVGFFLAMDSIFGGSAWTYPTDDAMLAHWRKNRPAMEDLVTMMRADARLHSIAKTWSVPSELAAAGISDDRAARYRNLLREAGILSLGHSGQQIEPVYYTQGFGPGGTAKCSVFGPPPGYVDQVKGDLDEASKGLRAWNLQRRIEGDWWLLSTSGR